HADGLAARRDDGLGGLLHAGLVDVGGDDLDALASQGPRGRPADAASGPGDHGDAAVQILHVPLPAPASGARSAAAPGVRYRCSIKFNVTPSREITTAKKGPTSRAARAASPAAVRPGNRPPAPG